MSLFLLTLFFRDPRGCASLKEHSYCSSSGISTYFLPPDEPFYDPADDRHEQASPRGVFVDAGQKQATNITMNIS
jgi:hypothetical protein